MENLMPPFGMFLKISGCFVFVVDIWLRTNIQSFNRRECDSIKTFCRIRDRRDKT